MPLPARAVRIPLGAPKSSPSGLELMAWWLRTAAGESPEPDCWGSHLSSALRRAGDPELVADLCDAPGCNYTGAGIELCHLPRGAVHGTEVMVHREGPAGQCVNPAHRILSCGATAFSFPVEDVTCERLDSPVVVRRPGACL